MGKLQEPKSGFEKLMEEAYSSSTYPIRILEYLLDWKENNIQEFKIMHGSKKLTELSAQRFHELFRYATTKDATALSKISD